MVNFRRAFMCVILICCLAIFGGCQKADEQAQEVKERASAPAGTLKEEPAGTAETIREEAAAGSPAAKVEDVEDKASEASGDLTEEAVETAGALKEEATEAAGNLKDEVADVAEKAEETLAQAAPTLTTGEPSGAGYIGAQKCKACHLKQYKSWSETVMAASFENLKPGAKAEAKKKAGLDPDRDYTHDAECVTCHSTGYGKGGFVSIEETPHLAGVQCEACHGPGSEYSVLMKKNKQFKLSDAKKAGLIIPSEDEQGCRECHNSTSPFNEALDPQYAFNFKERLEKTHEHFPLKYHH